MQPRAQTTPRTARGTTSTSSRPTRATTPSSGNYQLGISVFDFTNPAAAAADRLRRSGAVHARAPTSATAGNWSTHCYNGKIYESDIRRGLIIWDLDHDADAARPHAGHCRTRRPRSASFAQDLEGPTITVAAPLEGRRHAELPQIADFGCADSDSGVESCVGTVADGAAIDTSTIGYHMFKVTAKDKAGTVTDEGRPVRGQQHRRHDHSRCDRAGDAVAGLGHAGDVRRVHAGRRQRYTATSRRT